MADITSHDVKSALIYGVAIFLLRLIVVRISPVNLAENKVIKTEVKWR